jgi:predicted metal-binding membrane protein
MALILEQPGLCILLAALSAIGWGWSLRMATSMHHGAGLATLFVMWAAMMVGMMIPPEAPALLQLARARRSPLEAAASLAGFLLPWIAFSLAAAALHSSLAAAGMLDHAMATTSPTLAGALAIGAGLVQISPLKRACLDRCRAPLEERPAFVGGLRSSTLSIGSCGMLMLVLFATGVMSVPAMALLTLLLLFERWLPRSWPVSTVAGLLLVGWGLWRLSAPEAW